MKILNILIALLVVSIIVSGGFLGYTIYTQNLNPIPSTDNDDASPMGTSSITPTPIPSQNTKVETGCTDLFEQGEGTSNQLADIQLNFTTDATSEVSTGDTIEVTAEILTVNPSTTWTALRLRMIYPCNSLRYIEAETVNSDYLNIPVDTSYDNIVENHLASTKENFEAGDQLIKMYFEVIEEGDITLQVADDSIILDSNNQEYSIATNKVSL